MKHKRDETKGRFLLRNNYIERYPGFFSASSIVLPSQILNELSLMLRSAINLVWGDGRQFCQSLAKIVDRHRGSQMWKWSPCIYLFVSISRWRGLYQSKSDHDCLYVVVSELKRATFNLAQTVMNALS
jgi:hypothetical protein